MIKRDGHIHTPFCPHGTKDSLEAYANEAIRLGREEITFTEHFPLPNGVTSESFARECSLLDEEVPLYLEAVAKVKEAFRAKLKINRGFEVDYVEGFEKEITKGLNKYGTEIDDAILSVHFVRYAGNYYAVDYLPDFEELLNVLGSLESVYDLYFQSILKSIEVDLGPFKPKRLGHPSLVRIFNKKHPIAYDDKGIFEKIVSKMVQGGYEIDFNVAGLRKIDCKETYPSDKLLELVKQYGIKRVWGSDSHEVAQLALLSDFNEVLL